ncbi:MAG: type II toxin-antitoxin system prevent-host-death family antitoxin [Opitutales bacterium]|nr:type II toxin-antitoxin system prevent-host-death family antitoxin [Opitutales bacterium]
MNALTYTDVRSNFANVMDKVCDDHEPVIITRSKKRPVVMMSFEDYESIEETMYLLRSPKNAARLREAISNVEKGKFKEKELLES